MQFLCLTIDYNEGEKKGLATGELNLSWILIHSMTFPISQRPLLQINWQKASFV